MKTKQIDLAKREARRQELAKMGIYTEEQARQAIKEARERGLFRIGFLTTPLSEDMDIEVPND